ncbi:hypothetical protein BDK51DRAFT_17354 [Blyttiomyces helicus]|uniref:D-lactate dehydrogenase (cytochrome) n=1 Tax=Blyttiomyces helicus TaxID=388810 RepID=A0A4P9WF66_9FUNG|nr:hypothetical protein BDK51DRAFT_17354 [Blyttiomyces helicus]|eukprot:RKO91052.1 hypothetical protein BDK51DRAFT_17354 [Blyttiomyces helicus]
MSIDQCIAQLRTLLLPPQVVTAGPEIVRLSKSLSYHTPHEPRCVVFAESEADIVAVLKCANSHKVPVIPVAGRSSIEGATIPLASVPTISLDVSRMDRVVALHEDDLDVVVQPGVGWMELEEVLKPVGLFFPPDPGAAACVGGMCGTNCSGTFAWRYGTMKDNVISLRVVLPDGTVVRTRRRPKKSSAGYDLTRLFIGSEGTMGIISEITLRLRPIPKLTCVALACFASIEDAGAAVQHIVKEGIDLQRMELMDSHAIHSINLSRGISTAPLAEQSTLLFELAGPSPTSLAEQLTSVQRICKSSHATLFRSASDAAESTHLWAIRKTAYFAAKRLRPDLPSPEILTTDVAVPISRLAEALSRTRADLASHSLKATILAHAGDGNFHCLLVVDPANVAEMKAVSAFRDRNAHMAIDMDGTCTGEHGVGTGKVHLLEREVGPEALGLMRTIKAAVDPNGIMNPGKVLARL